jgi:photosystem II stability/assembly factor-like uncharacterized protein
MRRSIARAVVVVLVAAEAVAGQTGEPRRPARKPATAPAGAGAAAPPARTVDPLLLKAFTARAIGPAIMGGRIPDIALDPRNSWTFYVGVAHGGLMKTTDNGGSFTPLMDKMGVYSVGAVAVSPANPDVVWVGSGEANDRNSSGWGDGVYRSTDAGATWSRVGLLRSRTIARLALHPTNADVAYVAAMGDLWNAGGERGLYKTSDGGRSWTRVLAASAPDTEDVGAGDVVIDPSAPDTVYAVLYARRRAPWAFVSGPALTGGRDAGGIFKTTDGGATWTKLAGGLPPQTGRIGLTISAGQPQTLYAIVESAAGGTSSIDEVRSRRGGVFRTDDGGATWTRRNALNPRPFYFSKIRVDPSDVQHVYVLGYALHVSEDGGETFREDRFAKVHPDNHALVIDPRDPKRLLLGTDGGVYQSFDRGARWAHLSTMAVGEFYRISLDASTPYRICGGLQDNLNWVGPSATATKDGIVHSDWINVQGGDGFYCVFDPDDPDIVFAESQSGYVHRLHLKSGALKLLRPEPPEGQPAFRFHWSSPLIGSRHTKGRMYLAGNRIFALDDRGESWRTISPDLTTNDVQRIVTTGSGAETYAVVFTLAESPVKPGLLWAGTDDGKLWITENDGGSWTDLTASLPAAAKGQWIARVEASAHDAAVAYLVVSAFRSGNYAPLVYRTADAGRSWQPIVATLPPDRPARVVREDPGNASILYLGTQGGLFVSLDRGASWTPLGGLPPVPVDDLAIHPQTHDLVVATHGRSLFIVDDVAPLRELTAVQDTPAHLFAIPPARAFEPLPGWAEWAGTAVYRGSNPPVGARFDVFVKAYTGEPISVAVTTKSGRPVATLTAPGVPGLTRLVWDLRPAKDVLTTYGGEGALFVRPGEYDVTLTYGELRQKRTVLVSVAPGLETR